NKIGKVFRRYGGVFDKRQRACFTFHIAEQAHGFFTHAPDFIDCLIAPGNAVADTASVFTARATGWTRGRGLIEFSPKLSDLFPHIVFIITSISHQMKALDFSAARRWKKISHAVPDNIVHRQVEDL